MCPGLSPQFIPTSQCPARHFKLFWIRRPQRHHHPQPLYRGKIMSPRYAHITGWGMAVPEKILTNADLEKQGDTEDEWIVSRTGSGPRHNATAGQTTTTLAAAAPHG